MITWKHLITGLALGCFVLANGLALPQVVRHSLHHGHHTATTHTSTICFWVCTAGQVEETPSIFTLQVFTYLGELDTPLTTSNATSPTPTSKARAPPHPIQ